MTEFFKNLKSSINISKNYKLIGVSSFEAVTKWADQVRKVRGDHSKIVLIGNKVDLQHERVVTTSDGY